MSPSRKIHPEQIRNDSLIDDLSLQQNSRLVELLICCKDLRNDSEKNSLHTTCALFTRKFGQWKEYDRTETIYHNSSPKYCRTFSVEHHLDSSDEKFKFELYLVNHGSSTTNEEILFGKVEIDFSELIDYSSNFGSSSFPLMMSGVPKPRGHLCIISEVIKPTRSKVLFHCGGSKLKRKGMLTNKKPHTFLEISRSIDAVDYHPIYRSAVSWESSEPRWKPFEISLEKLCNSDDRRNIRFSVNHHSKEGSILIGELETNLEKLIAVAKSKARTIPLRKSLSSNVKDSMKEKGQLRIYDLILEHHYTFLDFMRGGCQCKLYIGIDFTLSNGCHKTDKSFHGNNEDDRINNIYQPAIQSVLNVFTPYVKPTSSISAFGFGAKIYKSTKVNHCFTINPLDDEITTTDELLDQYYNILPHLKFAGPTYLTPLLEEVSKKLKADMLTQAFQHYSFLIIFTDGVLNDMDEFKRQLNECKDLPLSVLIVGVGPMDLEALEYFDTRNESVSNIERNKQSEKFRENSHFYHFKSRSIGVYRMVCDGFTTMAAQVVNYMKQKGITPNPPTKQQLNESAQIYEIGELRASIRRRMTQKKSVSNSQSTVLNCPTCGHVINESTDL